MRTFVKGLIAVAVMFIGLFVFKPCSVYAASQYNDYQEQYNVSPSKAWKVTFNKPVNLYTAQNYIGIYDSADNAVPVTISIDANNSKAVTVRPIYDYQLGKRYYMIIKSSCASNLSKHLNSDVRMFFNIKTKLDPSDYNGGNSGSVGDLKGIIIVGPDRAYSVSYLLQNADLANDINGNTSKDVYYIPDPLSINNEKIQNIFGDRQKFNTYTSMKDLHDKNTNSITYISDNIVYTDAIGNNYAYVWNSNLSAYELKTSSINVSVQLPSTTGAVTLTVDKVNAISGAAFYQIDGTNIKRAIGESVTDYVTMNSQIKVNILSSNQTAMGYAYVRVDTTGQKLVPVTMNDDSDIGSNKGNSNNNGSAVMDDDDYTYYLNSGDGDTIYKEDASGEYNIQIGLDRAQYMNEQNGWLYYSNYSDDEKIYRIHVDGTRREKVCDDKASFVVVYGDWVYYSNQSDGGKLYKVGVSAGASTKDDIQPDKSTYNQDAAGIHGLIVNSIKSSQNIPYDEVAYINISHGWIYYVNNSDDHKIYKIDTSGNFRTKVNDEWSACPQVVGNEIYYCSKIGEIMKIGTDGKSSPVDLGAQVNESDTDQSFHINVNGDWIYYSNKNDNKTLYKVKIDGSGQRYKLTTMPINYVITAGERLFIVSNRKEYTLPITTTGADVPKPVTKTNPDNQVDSVADITKVVEYEDVNQTIEWIEDKYLPEKVGVNMKDDQQWQLTVSWDTKNKTFNNGVYTYTGNIVGYNKTVKLDLIVPSEMLNGTNIVQIINNPDTDHDIIKVSNDKSNKLNTGDLINKSLTETKIKPGDYIRVYSDSSLKDRIDKGGAKGVAVTTVGGNPTAIISGINLDNFSGDGAIYITVQRNGKYESNATRVLQMDAPTILENPNTKKSAEDDDSVYPGVTGRDFSIYGWTEATWKNDEINTEYNQKNNLANDYNSMYIVPSASSLDVSNDKIAPIKVSKDGAVSSNTIKVKAGETQSTVVPDVSIDRDSLNGKLVGGAYSIYVSRHYNEPDTNTFVTADPNGSRPIVTGDTVSAAPASEITTDEEVPDTGTTLRTITSPTTKNPNRSTQVMIGNGVKLTLSKPLADDEQIWFVPVNFDVVDGYLAWKYYDPSKSTTQFTPGDTNCLYEFYNYRSNAAANGVIIGPQGQQNNFDVSGLTPKVEYKVYILNNVGSTKLINTIIRDIKAPTLAINGIPDKDSTGANYHNGVTGSNVIKMTYSDEFVAGVRNDSVPGYIYVYQGNLPIDAIKNTKPIASYQVTDNGINNTWNLDVANLPKGTGYDITIVAEDAAGNIIDTPIHVTVTNTSGSSTVNN